MAATGAPWLPLPLPHFTPPTQTQVPVGGETVNYLVIDSILPPHPHPPRLSRAWPPGQTTRLAWHLPHWQLLGVP